jgi:copper chaperone
MKNVVKLLSAALVAFTLIFSASFAAENNKAEFKTSAYSWMCKNKIESSINKIDGIKDCELDLATKTLTVEYDDTKVNTDKIKEVIEDLGYDAKIKPECDKMADTKKQEKQR